MGLLLRGVELGGSRLADVRIGRETITEVAPALGAGVGEEVIEGHGSALLPGLHDHHLHLRAAAAAARSVRAGPPDVRDAATFGNALRRAAAGRRPGDWVRAVGYHESVAGPLDRWVLDRLVADRPARVQHRSGELWILNSTGLEAVGLERDQPEGAERDGSGRLTGRLWRLDRWLRDHLPADAEGQTGLAGLAAANAAAGVTGYTDAGPDTSQSDADALARLVEDGAIPQRVVLLGPLDLISRPSRGLAVVGTKVLLDDLTLPTLDDLVNRIVASHARGRPVAVHCVTRVQLVLTLAALAAAGPVRGDRIEHASVVPAELIREVRKLGVTVVTQPNFVAERGDEYLAEVDPADRPGLYRLRSLLTAGIPVGAGTDAPFGFPDVWAAMRAAVDRVTPAGEVLGPDERITAADALGLFLGDPREPGRQREIVAGLPADVCLLRGPLAAVLADLDADAVAMTVIAGRVVSRRA